MLLPRNRVKLWRDISPGFLPALNRDVSPVSDVDAITTHIRTLLLLKKWDCPFHPEISSGLFELSFELWTPQVGDIAKAMIINLISQNENRATLQNIQIDFSEAENAMTVRMDLKIVGIPDIVPFVAIIERVR